jgi:hypothetical protein
MSGYLSQALANLAAAERQITNLLGLPPAARPIQADSSAVIGPMITQVQTLQKTVADFVRIATSQLNGAETLIAGNQPLAAIKAAMATVRGEADTLKSKVDGLSSQISAASSRILGYFNQLATVESALASEMGILRGQLGTAQGEESAAKSKYYWLIALGPFGLIGLAVALGLYLKWQSDVNGYESQIAALNGQISALVAMKSTCQQLGTDFQGVVTKISGIRNSGDFLASDILTINTDLDAGSALSVIGIMVKAAITQVTTLGVDAS